MHERGCVHTVDATFFLFYTEGHFKRGDAETRSFL